MAENKPLSLYELGKQGDKQNKAFNEAANKNAQQPTQSVVEKRGETPEERATYARLMKLNDYGASALEHELSKMDGYKEKMGESALKVAEMQSKLKPQEHDPLKVDSGRIMRQNITQRATQKMVDEPTSVEGVEDKSKAAAKYFGFEPYILKPDVQSRKAMRDVFDSTDPLYESQGLAAAFKYIDTLPTNEEGKIVVDGIPYTRMELAQGLAPQIVSANSGSLFVNNATYRDDMAKRMGYKNMDSYLAALDQRLAAMQRDLANQVSAQHAIQTPFNGMAGLEALATQERAGAKVLRDLRDQIKSMRAGEGGFEQFFKGLNEGFDAVNMATFGIADLASEYKQNIVYNKMLNGETLTPEERILADALNIKSDLDALREAQGQSWYNKIGAGVGYIGELAPQFVGPMLAAKGLFKTINVGAKGALELTKRAAKKEGFKAAFKTGLGATARVGAKGLDNLARFQINGMLVAPLQASTYSRFLEKRNAQYSIKDGKVTYTPTDAWRDLVDTWIEQGAEIGSELFGVSLEKFTSASLAAIGRNIGLGKVMRKIGGSVRNVETSKAMRFVKSGATKAGQQLFGYAGGVLPETLSEIYGDLTSEMFKSVLTGNGNFEEFKNPTYWATAFALPGIYGGAMSVLPSMMDYASYMRDISALGDIKKKILSDGKIEHTDLKNALIALSAGGSIKDATEHLAELDWKNGGYSLEEIGYAMDYIRAEAMQQVRMGEATESQRLQRFGNVAQNIEAHAYRDEDGMPSGSMVMAVDKDGNSYHILEGDYSNAEATLKALNSEGKVVPLLASNIESLSKASIADVTLFYYQQMFSTEFNLQRLESAEYAIERMDNPTMAQVADVAKRVGIVMPKEGDTITLVDGRTAKVTSISDDLGIMAEMINEEGNLSVVPIPIMQILSSNTYIAEAQKLQNAEDALELAQAEEAQTEAEDAVEEGDAAAEVATEEESNGIIGTEVTLPNGNKGTIVEVDGDDVVVDTGRGVDAYEVYSKEELGMTEAEEMTTPQPAQTTAEQTSTETATEQTTGEVTPEQATEALNEIAGIKPVPTLEDGSIDYDAIDDAETFAKHFEHDMGSREEAVEGVREMREQAMADLAEAEKKGKKARSANEKIANKVERQRLAERIAFYDNVLDIYTPKAEAPATPIESAPQVDTTPSQTEVQSPAEAAEAVQPSETIAEEQGDGYSKYNEKLGRPVGLQHNELSERLEEKTRRMINDVATAFGVEVIFQREVRSSAGNLVNGKIEGSTVYFNWGIREHTLTWLMGHEFTHRMKSLSPEAYEKLRDAVRAYLGEGKWNRLIEKQRKIYEERENPEKILTSAESAAIWEEAKEQTKREDGSFDEEAAKKLYNKKVAEARREAYIEEVVCDEVGVLARDHKAFDRFLRSEHVRNDGKFLRWLRKVWQSLKSAFIHDVRTFNEVMKTLDELINVSTAEVAKGVEPTEGGENNSLVGEQNAETPEVAEAVERIESKGGVVDAQRGDVKYALSDVLTVPERESAIQDLMRVTGRSRATVQKYLKAEQRTTEGRDLANRLGSQRKAIDMFWKLNSIGASGYKRLAGEVEARNVEKRAGMPMAERLATLVEETEDVAREDQIIILEGINGVAEMAKKMKGTADRNASEFGQPTTQKDSPSLSRFGAKLRKDFESAIGQLQKGITTNDKLGVHEFLYELDNALTGKPKVSKNESQYIHVGNGVTLRLSDHYSNAKSFDDANNNKDNFGIVIRTENENRKKSVFKKHPNVDYVEYVYYPDKLDKDRQLNILQGVVQFIKTKDFEQLPTPDDTHVSVDKSTVTQTLTTPNGDEADGTRYSLREESAPTRYSLQSGDMPFFNDNGDVITFDNTDITGEDYDAVELRSPMPTTPRTTEEVIKAHLSARHNATKERIRRESHVLRDAVRKQYREEQVRRREGVETMRTNAAKVDYIIGAPIETLDYEAQVLAMIAMGTLSISWESLSKELGVKSGDKKSYRHITNGATATLDAVVHAWWESINGYENGIDTQDLRNALIDVLMQVPTAKGALSILEDRFDHALRNRDEALEDIDREEDRLIAEEDARYNEQMTTLSDPARMSEYVRQYEQTVGFHEELTAIEGTLRKMDSELKAVRKRAERAQMRSKASKQKQFDKSKEIIGKQREFYKDKLAEQRASFKEVREAITESKRALLEALSTYEQLGFNKQEVRSLVDAVNKARSMADINKVRVKIENVILNVSIREKRRHMDQMLNLRLPSGELVETWVSKQIHDGKMNVADGKRILADMFRGTNANGVRVAKYVDDETARVMDYLRKNLIVPNHGAHYEEKKDADGNVIGREYVPSREEEMGADVLLKSNNELCNKLLGKAVEGTITEEEKIKLQARQLYEPYLFVANARAYVKGVRAEGEKLYEEIQRKKAELGDAYTKEMRDADYAALEANALHLVEAKTAYDDALTEYNETLSNVIMSGRDKLREFREAKEAHKAEVVNMAIRAIGGEARTISQPTAAEKVAAWNRTTFHSTYWTFDSACREIDRFAPNGEGEFYKHFMGGMTKASNDFFTRTDNHIQDICDAVRRITGSKRDPRRALRAFMRKADMTTVGSITYKNDKGEMEPLPLRISNALFTLAMWGQAQYREIMEKRGITQEQMEALKAKIESIDGRYIDFMEWVIDSFLPSTRLEYNEVHKQLFGASMDNIENYFPAKVVEGYRDEDIAQVDSGLPSTMTGSIITRQKHNNLPQFDQSFFSVLLNHTQNMDQWASFSPLVEDLNAVISNPEFKRLVNTHMAGVDNDRTGKGSLWQIFKDTSAVAIGSYSCKTPVADSMISKFTGAWAASNISWRFSTALKQLSGLTAVAVSGLGKTQGMFLKNMMLSPLAVKWAMENSPMLQKRFGDRFAGNEALIRKYGQNQAKGLDLRKGKLKDGLERVNDFIRFLTVDVGMTPNAAVDALVVAITMKTVYDVELSNLTKGKPESATEEQKSYAMMKAEIFANETQQSAEGAYLSVPQAQRSAITAALTTYLNASFASHRLRVQGVQDIYRWMSPKYRKEIDDRYGKGAARKAAGKGFARLLAGLSIDATFILMSRAVSQGLWRLIIDWFDDTEDDDDEADPIDWNDIGKEIGLNVAFGGLLGGIIVTTLGNGFTFTPIPALDEFKKDVFNALGWTDKKIKDGDWSIDLNFWALGEIIFKYGYGLDPETMLNIARGIEGICRDKDPMAAMKLLNTPQSMVNIIAGPRRNNETVKEYVERIARLEVLFAEPKFSELYDDELNYIGDDKYTGVGGAKKYRLKSLAKEYNERQRAAVMSKYLSPSEVVKFERIDSEYKAIVESLGWEVGKNPQDDKVDKTGWRNIYPEGLTNVHYAALKGIATAAERTRRAQDRWVGSDQGYANLVREEYNLREQLIAGRRSSYKAKTAKEKIDRAEKQRKKNQKK